MVANPFLNLEDKELMLKYQNGDHMAFDVLYARHKDKVYSYLSKRLHSDIELDDLFQKVFIKFHKSRMLYHEKYEVLPWLYTITRSEFLDFLKKHKMETTEFREKLYLTNHKDDETIIDLDTEKKLSEKEKAALSERYYADKDFSEIAELLQTSEPNVRKLISRALQKLKHKYKGEKA